MMLARPVVTGNSENPNSEFFAEMRCVVCDEVENHRLLCAAQHAVCNTCFSQFLKITWPTKDFPLGEPPQVQCVCKGCIAPPFSSQEIAKHADPEAWAVYEEQVGKANIASALGKIQQEAEQKLVRQRNATVTTTITTTSSQSTTTTSTSQPTTTSSSDQPQVADSAAQLSEVEQQSQYLLGRQLAMQLKAPKMCPRCKTGPVEIAGCENLMAHHGERRSRGLATDNSCQCCGFFSETAADWPAWDGIVRDAATNTWTGMTKKRKIELISQAFECDEERAKDVLAAGQAQIARGNRRARLFEVRERMRERLPLPFPQLPAENLDLPPFVPGIFNNQPAPPVNMRTIPPRHQRARPQLVQGHPAQGQPAHPPMPAQLRRRVPCMCANCGAIPTVPTPTIPAPNIPLHPALPRQPDTVPDSEVDPYRHYDDFMHELMFEPLIGSDLDATRNEIPLTIRGATTTTSRRPTLTSSPLRSTSVTSTTLGQAQPDSNPQVQVEEEIIDAGRTSWRFHISPTALECSRRGLTITLFRHKTDFEVTDGSGTRKHFFLNVRQMRVEVPQERSLPVQEEGWSTNVPVRFGEWNIATGVNEIILFNTRHQCVMNLNETSFSVDSHAV